MKNVLVSLVLLGAAGSLFGMNRMPGQAHDNIRAIIRDAKMKASKNSNLKNADQYKKVLTDANELERKLNAQKELDASIISGGQKLTQNVKELEKSLSKKDQFVREDEETEPSNLEAGRIPNKLEDL